MDYSLCMQDHITSPTFFKNPHAFLSRADGVSTGIYAGLNCGVGSNDDPDTVAENRRIAASLISGRRDTPLLSVYQVHGATVQVVTEDWGAERPKADAMVTKTKGLVLAILTADCTPVLFEDSHAGVIGAAHAGWKGALRGVLDNTLKSMQTLGADLNRIVAVIGPTIAQKSYEVDTGFRDNFLASSADNACFFEPGKDNSHFQFDLPAYVRDRLSRAGCTTIHDTAVDTYSSEDHFSFRRTTHRGEADYGRQVSGIMLAS